MTYLLAWTICCICTFCLAKSYIETLFRPYEGLPSVCRKVWLEDEENTPEDRFILNEMPDSFIAAILYTMLLIFTIFLWPIVLCVIIWLKIFPLDMTELEEYRE